MNIVKKLSIFQEKVLEFRSDLIIAIDNIQHLIEQWIADNLQMEFLNHEYLKELLHGFQQLLLQDQLRSLYMQLKEINNDCLKSKKQVQVLTSNIIETQQIVGTQPKEYQLKNKVKCEEVCFALAFNYTGSIMVSGCNQNIRVWNFHQGQLQEEQRLIGHTNIVSAFAFSRIMNCFFSGSGDKTIRCWKQINGDWVSSQPTGHHYKYISCLLLNKSEDELISSSFDKSIIVWKFHYIFESWHINDVNQICMNPSETALVSCGYDKRIVLWQKVNNKWLYQNHINMKCEGNRVVFVSDTDFLWQPAHIDECFHFQIDKIKLQKHKVKLKDSLGDYHFFPSVYNFKREILIHKKHKYIYFIKKSQKGKYSQVLDPIVCQDEKNFGSLTDDGQFLVISSNKEILVFQIKYE